MRPDSGYSRTSLVLAVAAAASLTGCQPVQNTPHTCPCVCYKEKGNNVWISQAPTSTTFVNCGDLNGTGCTGGAGGTATFEGTLQHCGPYTNVALDPLHHFLNYNPTAVQGKSQ